jgi:hypothetical protein
MVMLLRVQLFTDRCYVNLRPKAARGTVSMKMLLQRIVPWHTYHSRRARSQWYFHPHELAGSTEGLLMSLQPRWFVNCLVGLALLKHKIFKNLSINSKGSHTKWKFLSFGIRYHADLYTGANLHGFTSQKKDAFTSIYVRTSNFAKSIVVTHALTGTRGIFKQWTINK